MTDVPELDIFVFIVSTPRYCGVGFFMFDNRFGRSHGMALRPAVHGGEGGEDAKRLLRE